MPSKNPVFPTTQGIDVSCYVFYLGTCLHIIHNFRFFAIRQMNYFGMKTPMEIVLILNSDRMRRDNARMVFETTDQKSIKRTGPAHQLPSMNPCQLRGKNPKAAKMISPHPGVPSTEK
jgi:hypothetical protein